METAQLEAKIEGLGGVYKISLPFDMALKALKQSSSKIITARDLAYARMQKGRNSSLCNDGSYIQQGIIHRPNQYPLVIQNSPILQSAGNATQCHRKNEEFYINSKKYQEIAEKDKNKEPEAKRILTVEQHGEFEVPTDRFGEEKLTLFLFKDQAKDYGLFLKDNKINKMPVALPSENYVNKQDEAFARQLWLCWVGDAYVSALIGNGRDLYGSLSVRGVCKGAEGTQKISNELPYTQRELNRHLNLVQRVRSGEQPNLKLEKVEKFLSRLKQ